MKRERNGVILVNAYLRAPGMVRQAERVAEELRVRGVAVQIVKNGAFLSDVRKNVLTLAQKCDFVVNLDKDKYLPRMLEKGGCACSTPPGPSNFATTRCSPISNSRGGG